METEIQNLAATSTTEIVTGISKGGRNNPQVDQLAVAEIVVAYLCTSLDNYRPTESFNSYTASIDDLRDEVMSDLHESERGITWDEKDGKHIVLENDIHPAVKRGLSATRAVLLRTLRLTQLHLETNYPELLGQRRIQVKIAKAMAEGIRSAQQNNVTLMSAEGNAATREADLVKREQKIKQKEETLKRRMKDLMEREMRLMDREARVEQREWMLKQKEDISRRERIIAGREERVIRRENALKEQKETEGEDKTKQTRRRTRKPLSPPQDK